MNEMNYSAARGECGKSPSGSSDRKRGLPEINVAETRKELKLSQKAFASVLGVSSRTVEAWEAGKINPSPTAVNLIYLIKNDPSLILKLQTQ